MPTLSVVNKEGEQQQEKALRMGAAMYQYSNGSISLPQPLAALLDAWTLQRNRRAFSGNK